ncbi:MAG: cytochrome c biogenesis protein ResB [ANME-2 cluster archaeon]|nr:cytochrome c biogenesis protein ResB [ANME-2 cluster archaeon]
MWKNISIFFKSKQLALFLIILLILIAFIGSIVPQRHTYTPVHFESLMEYNPWLVASDNIGLTNIFSSWMFFVTVIILLFNSAFCTYGMLRLAIRRFGADPVFKGKDPILASQNRAQISTSKRSEESLSQVESTLRSKRYRTSRNKNRIYSEKNRLGVFGVAFFHLCIILVFVAVLYGGAGRMEGKMQIVEGQMLLAQEENYGYLHKPPLFKIPPQDFGIYFEKFNPNYIKSDGTLMGAASKLLIVENETVTTSGFVYSNRQISYNGIKFYQADYGFAPLLLLKNSAGDVLSGSYMPSFYDGDGGYVSQFTPTDTKWYSTATLYPSDVPQSSEFGADVPHNPKIQLTVFEGENELYNGTLVLNESVSIGNVSLGFYDLKYASVISLVSDKGTPILFAGFWLSVASLFTMYFMIPRRIWVEVLRNGNGTFVYIGGKTDRFRSSFEDEFLKIVEEIGEVVKDESD